MDEIRPWLFIGGYRDTVYKELLDRKSIRAMLQLAESVEQPGIESLFLHVEDMDPIRVEMIEKGILFIHTHAGQGHNILISCGAGINRATAFCVIALKEIEGLGLFEAFQEVARRHPEALPNLPVWESLCEYYGEEVPYLDVMRLAAKNQ
ncbi:MAG: dual specificity protein phosphatase family protein [Anaerolineales bacterium]|nr:dual specificity protein phosphatase family protein [Anaerolineales bacterium]